MDFINILFHIIAITAFTIWRIVWHTSEKTADTEKPKTKNISLLGKLQHYGTHAVYYLTIIQLLGFPLFSIPHYQFIFMIQFIGTVFVITGISIMIHARKQLHTNWANSYEFQIKHKQELITTGLYAIIRHPIYLGIFLLMVGSEMIVQSYLFIVYAIILTIVLYRQAKMEEGLLMQHFGELYKQYREPTNMFIPFIL